MSWFNRDRETIKHNAAFVAEEIRRIHNGIDRLDARIDAKQNRYIELPNGTTVPVKTILLALSELQDLKIIVSSKQD